MSGFSIDWLNRREDADRRARDPGQRAQALTWLRGQTPLAVDLGAGTGSTLRALDDSGEFNWRLVDLDEALLKEAQRRHTRSHSLETCIADLSNVSSLPLTGAGLITASALFDLVSADFVHQLAERLKLENEHHPLGLYSALNYDGTTRWTPAHPLDDVVLDAFNRDQRRDKGFGPALGPTSGHVIQDVFTLQGFQTHAADSPWELDGADQPLVSVLISGIASAVADSEGLDTEALAEWVRFRQSRAATGTCTVGHTDVLVLPA